MMLIKFIVINKLHVHTDILYMFSLPNRGHSASAMHALDIIGLNFITDLPSSECLQFSLCWCILLQLNHDIIYGIYHCRVWIQLPS